VIDSESRTDGVHDASLVAGKAMVTAVPPTQPEPNPTRAKVPDVPGAAGTSYKRPPVRMALWVSHYIPSPVTEALRVRPPRWSIPMANSTIGGSALLATAHRRTSNQRYTPAPFSTTSVNMPLKTSIHPYAGTAPTRFALRCSSKMAGRHTLRWGLQPSGG
jgi:hypothetical protein